MNLPFKALFTLFFLLCVGCSAAQDTEYMPSIEALAADETLVMKYRACHNGCIKGKVSFKNGSATVRSKSISLTLKEISDLDSYFLLGEEIGSESFFCSLPIYISFKQRKFLRTIKRKRTQIYPCFFGLDDPSIITAELLINHLQDTPDKTPFWRLSPEEQSRVLVIF